jgi:hypothetical protein
MREIDLRVLIRLTAALVGLAMVGVVVTGVLCLAIPRPTAEWTYADITALRDNAQIGIRRELHLWASQLLLDFAALLMVLAAICGWRKKLVVLPLIGVVTLLLAGSWASGTWLSGTAWQLGDRWLWVHGVVLPLLAVVGITGLATTALLARRPRPSPPE